LVKIGPVDSEITRSKLDH